jgi:hypothetical protein
MLLNPIPWNSYDSEVYLFRYIFFSIITILAITFIAGIILTRKYNKHQRLTGKIFAAIGIIELIPYIIAVIQIIMLNLFYQLYNPYLFLFTLGCITLTGGVANIKQTKSDWTFFLIMAAIIVIVWTFDYLFVFIY